MPPLRAFVVEDSPVILENLVGTLQEFANVSVVGSAADESSALVWLSREPDARSVDLLIIDIFLRSGTGLTVLLAAKKVGLRARRVVLTNYATDDMRKRCLALGAERVFDKSCQLDELINYCSDLAAGQGTQTRIPLG
jgi:DNA-binding NarL/FixJ family response regulator